MYGGQLLNHGLTNLKFFFGNVISWSHVDFGQECLEEIDENQNFNPAISAFFFFLAIVNA